MHQNGTNGPFHTLWLSMFHNARSHRARKDEGRNILLRKLTNITSTNGLLIFIAAVVAVAAIYGAWWWLGWYIAPKTATDRKDHVQVVVVDSWMVAPSSS